MSFYASVCLTRSSDDNVPRLITPAATVNNGRQHIWRITHSPNWRHPQVWCTDFRNTSPEPKHRPGPLRIGHCSVFPDLHADYLITGRLP